MRSARPIPRADSAPRVFHSGALVYLPRGGKLSMTTTVREPLADFRPFDAEALPAESHKKLRAAYGFDDVAIVPGVETLHPDDVDLSWELGGHTFSIPFIASAMDGVVDVPFAIALGRLGGLAVLNLEGLQTRYQRPEEPLSEIAAAPRESVTELMQHL